MSETTGEKKGKFEPKNPVQLDPPKDDPISLEHLAKCDGETYSTQDYINIPVDLTQLAGKNEGYPTYVAIKVLRF